MNNLERKLCDAAKRGDLEEVKSLVEKGADIHANDNFALCKAAENGRLEVVKFLVENGADIHAEDNLALCWAARGGHLKVVKFLIEKGVNIPANDYLALRLAAAHRHSEVVKFLEGSEGKNEILEKRLDAIEKILLNNSRFKIGDIVRRTSDRLDGRYIVTKIKLAVRSERPVIGCFRQPEEGLVYELTDTNTGYKIEENEKHLSVHPSQFIEMHVDQNKSSEWRKNAILAILIIAITATAIIYLLQ